MYKCEKLVVTSLVYLIISGNLPTIVLGQISAPDEDDWDHKTYHFEEKTSRYLKAI